MKISDCNPGDLVLVQGTVYRLGGIGSQTAWARPRTEDGYGELCALSAVQEAEVVSKGTNGPEFGEDLDQHFRSAQ